MASSLRPVDLRAERLVGPIGLGRRPPRLSWRLAAEPGRRGLRQVAWRIEVESGASLWSSGWVEGSEQEVDYARVPLTARQRCGWRVEVRDADGSESGWSETATFEIGLDDEDWDADWIGLAAPAPMLDLEGAHWLALGPARAEQLSVRVRFHAQAGPGRLCAAGGGVKAWLNGVSLGECDHTGHLAVDIGPALRDGENVLALAGGGPHGVIAKLVAGTTTVRSDDLWLASTRPDPGWQEPDHDDRAWRRPLALARYADPPAGREPRALRPSPLLRRSFTLDARPRRARLHATALGVYDAYLNGRRVSDDVLAPGWTDYATRVPYQCHDVTDRLRQGENVLGAVLADGWFAGRIWELRGVYGDEPLFRCQLEVELDDGRRLTIATDGSWQTATGEIVYADLLAGQTEDRRLARPGWSEPGHDLTGWSPVHVRAVRRHLVAQEAPPARVMAEVEPVAVTEPRPGVFVFDLGQNITGWARLHVEGPAGHKVLLRHAEILEPDGAIYTDNLRRAECLDEIILSGQGVEVFEPRFTYHGFRYVEVTGYPGRPDLDALTGCAVNADMAITGGFECSNADLNQLQRNIQWGQRGNFLSVPTDCPQRDERLGWTGDAQIFAATALFNMDSGRFLRKWLDDVVDAQGESGVITVVAPAIDIGFREGSAGWGDAIVIVPAAIHQALGDRRVIEECFPAMCRWVDYLERESDGLIRPAKGYGDWLSVDAETPKDLIATAYFAYSARLVGELAAVLGRERDAARYDALAARVRSAFRRRWVAGGGRVVSGSQTAYVLALSARLLDDDEVAPAAARLVADIERRGWHLSTGFLGLPWLLPALTETGHLDVAYRLLLQETWPSWLYPVRHGATTMWERWDSWTETKGVQDPGMNSFNHYAYGSVGEWMYGTVGGLRPTSPGWREVLIRPRPGGGITWARTWHDSPRGRIGCRWQLEEAGMRLDVEVPPGVDALVSLPAPPDRVQEGGTLAEAAPGVEPAGVVDGEARYRIGSGTYSFFAAGGYRLS
jgi:alpha-L-rhamnosidase